MDMASSTGYTAVAPVSITRTVVRWAVLGAAGVIALIIALSNSMTASAAAPVTYQTNCIPINYTTCIQNGTFGTVNNGFVAPNYGGVFNGNVVSVTTDNRYCGGIVYVVNEGGNLINRCPDGTRVVPIFPDYGFGGGFGNGFVGNNFIGGNFNNGFINNGFVNNGFVNNGGFFNNGAFPAGATFVGGNTYTYNDNRFCGDGKLFFVPGRGSFCQNGQGLNGNGFFGNGFAGNGFGGNGFVYPNYRFFEVAQPATAPVAAPVTAAPVVATTAPVAAPAAVQQAPVVAAPAQMPAALTAPQVQTPDAATTGGGSGIHVLSAPSVTAPAATKDSDDHRG